MPEPKYFRKDLVIRKANVRTLLTVEDVEREEVVIPARAGASPQNAG